MICGQPEGEDFAGILQSRLAGLGYKTWIAPVNSSVGSHGPTAIGQDLVSAHNLLVILIPDQPLSGSCQQLLGQALQYHKRIIPLVAPPQPLADHTAMPSPQAAATTELSGDDPFWHRLGEMHPALDGLSGLDFRAGLEASPAGLDALITTLETQAESVHLHTDVLAQMLRWQQHQHHANYLLTGEQRWRAERWLKAAFANPTWACQPTDDQCEFITASTRYADNGATQVLLCYADADLDLRIVAHAPASPGEPTVSHKRQANDARVASTLSQDGIASDLPIVVALRRLLPRAGFSLWDPDRDLNPCEDREAAISRATEACDTCVLLLSPRWPQNALCLQVLLFAVSMNKRILPVLLQPVATDNLPDSVQGLEPIDCCQPTLPLAESAAAIALVQQLNHDAVYHRHHRLLLTQALQWERQRRNASLLLRGAALHYYQTWLAAAEQRQQYRPIRVQKLFVNASLQANALTWDVYLIYDPRDLVFVRKLSHMLQLHSKSTCLDEPHSPEAPELPEASQTNLQAADNCLFVLSDAALENEHCATKLQQARSWHKRIIVIVYQSLPVESLPATLVTCPQINFQQSGRDFATNFGALYRILESDRQQVSRHTHLLLQAQGWHQAGRQDRYLLPPKELTQAKAWLSTATAPSPEPTRLQQEYVAASQALTRQRLRGRSLWLTSVAVTVVTVGLRLAGLLQPIELAAFDWLMRRRPSEPQDQRFLLVEVDGASHRWLREQMKQNRYQPSTGAVPDGTLVESLDILMAHAPALIGLSLERDFDAAPPLAERFVRLPSVVGLCQSPASGEEIAPPPEIPPDQVGFNPILLDTDNTVRRTALQQTPEGPCDQESAFSLVVAQTYLRQQGADIPIAVVPEPSIRLGAATVPQLTQNGPFTSHRGGYGPAVDFGRYQTMIHYRTYRGEVQDFAPRVSLQALLSHQVSPDLIRDRIVLIGSTDAVSDHYHSPYGEMTGVVLQGQLASQLISAALDDRPLLWWWPGWGETLWIFAWSTLAGLVVWRWAKPAAMGVGIGAVLLGIGSISYGGLVLGAGWLPLVPAALGSVWTAGITAWLTYRLRHPDQTDNASPQRLSRYQHDAENIALHQSR
jgi:CHASE2 domain-containing sensor protein